MYDPPETERVPQDSNNEVVKICNYCDYHGIITVAIESTKGSYKNTDYRANNCYLR